MLRDLEKCVLQVMMAKGLMAEAELLRYINYLAAPNPAPTKDVLFKTINRDIRDTGFEIKTIIDADDGNVYYHAVVNMEDDLIAKEHGTGYDAAEITIFSNVITKLVELGRISTGELEEAKIKPAKWSVSQFGHLLEQFANDNWIKRDGRQYWVLGLRSYLELRTFIETTIANFNEEDEGVAASAAAAANTHRQAAIAIEDLPQILSYF